MPRPLQYPALILPLPILVMVVLLPLTGCVGVWQRIGLDSRPPIPDLAPIAMEGVWHEVAQGETLGGLSLRYGILLQDVAELNDLPNPDLIHVGQMLFIPGAEKVMAHKGKIVPKGESQASSKVKFEKGRFIYPIPKGGRISSRYGVRWGRQHEGIDIAAPPGTPILATDGGEVIYSNSGLRGYGNLVIIRHDSRFVSVYAHNRVNLVKEGQQVKQGDTIAEVGSTGRSTGPHVHFEIREYGKPRNPLFFVDEPQ